MLPSQHILRNRPGEGNAPPLKVKFHEIYHVKYWSPHDLLGAFLSRIPAPPAATWDNFWVPLLYVYGRWAALLGSEEKVKDQNGQFVKDEKGKIQTIGAGPAPFMTSCAWINAGNANIAPRFILGCSIAGYAGRNDGAAGAAWFKHFQQTRFDLLHNVPIVPYNFDSSPHMDYYGKEQGTRFGNCAETYSFSNWMT